MSRPSTQLIWAPFHTAIWYASSPAGAAPDANITAGVYDAYGSMGAGDVDGDGRDDLLLGQNPACDFLSPAPGGGGGCAEVYFGPLAGEIEDGTAGVLLVGESSEPVESDPGELSAVDLTGDGLRDVLLVDPLADSGRYYVVESPLEPLVYLADVAIRFDVDSGPESLPPATLSAGDLDGDGYSDFLAATQDPGGGFGTAWVFRGPLAGELKQSDAWVTAPGINSNTGELSSDVDGDGNADLVLGTSEYNGYRNPDQVRIYYGPRGTVVADAIVRSQEDTTFDLGLIAAPGDVDGDGLADLVAGGMTAAVTGGAWVILGQRTGF